jgi:hypothetical protein
MNQKVDILHCNNRYVTKKIAQRRSKMNSNIIKNIIDNLHIMLDPIYNWAKNLLIINLMRLIMISILLNVIASIFVSTGKFLSVFGINNSTEIKSLPVFSLNDSSPHKLTDTMFNQINYALDQIIPILNQINAHIPYDINILSMAEGLALLLLGILLLGILREEQGITIMPFEDEDNFDRNHLNGNAISEMLIGELNKILKINKVDFNVDLSGNSQPITPNISVRNKISVPEFPIKSDNLNQNLKALGTLGLGSTSIPLGDILILIRKICPFTDPGLVITGCLQKYGRDPLIGLNFMIWKSQEFLQAPNMID